MLSFTKLHHILRVVSLKVPHGQDFVIVSHSLPVQKNSSVYTYMYVCVYTNLFENIAISHFKNMPNCFFVVVLAQTSLLLAHTADNLFTFYVLRFYKSWQDWIEPCEGLFFLSFFSSYRQPNYLSTTIFNQVFNKFVIALNQISNSQSRIKQLT